MKNFQRDPFVLFDIPRRPLIDLDLLEKKVRSLAAKHHPDHSTEEKGAFEEIQETAHLLRNPASRLRFLAGKATVEKKIPAIAEELFSTLATALNQAEEKITAYQAASGALAKALLIKNLLEARATLITAQESLHEWQHLLSHQLQELDATWPEVTPSALLTLANSFLFLQRWTKPVEEHILELQILIG